MANTNILISLVICFQLLTGLSALLSAQEFTRQVDYYGIENGLSHRDVQCIHQDGQGFMWLGTKYGLNRFDGSRFKWYTKEKQGLQSNEINHILEDSEELMWLFQTGSFNSRKVVLSIDLFDPRTQTVRSFEEKFGETAPFTPNDIICFDENESGHLIFFTRQNQLITYTGQFKVLSIDIGHFESIEKIHWLENGHFWVIAREPNELGKPRNHSLYLLDDQGTALNFFRHQSRHCVYVYDCEEGGRGKYIATLNDIIYKKNKADFFYIDSLGKQQPDTLSEQYFKLFDVHFHTLEFASHFKRHQNYYWIYTGDLQFKLIDVKTGNTRLLSRQYPHLESTTDVFFDKTNAAWVSTQFGVYRFRGQKSKFRQYLVNQKQKGKPDDFAIRYLAVDDRDQLWAMIENGDERVYRVDLPSGEENSLFEILDGPTYELMKHSRYAITTGRKDGIHLVSRSSIFRSGPLSQQYEPTVLSNEPSTLMIWTLHEDKYDKLWFFGMTSNETMIGYVRNGQVTRLHNWLSKDERFYIYHFLENRSDTAWLATSAGLFAIDIKNEKPLQRFWSKGADSSFMPFDNIHHIHPGEGKAQMNDDGSFFWLATAGTGLVQWSPSKGVIKQFTRADGLPDNTIYAIYEDEKENLWMSSNYGIIQFDKKTERIKGYSEKDGITHHEFNRISHHRDKKGNIYFGGLNGVTAFHPKDFYADTLAMNADLVITGFHQFVGKENKLIERTAELIQNRTITLLPDDHLFLLEFALLTYEETDKIQYAYQVEGVDEGWTYQKENSIRLSRLPYGSHQLCIKGQASDGQWSDNELQLKVVVLKPFYLQTWFLILSVCCLFAGVFLFFKWRTAQLVRQKEELELQVANRTKTIREQAEELKSLERLKSRFFANVSHELRTPLTLLLGPVKTLLKRKKEEHEDVPLLNFVHRNGNQLLKLINEILDLSKLESGKLELQEEPIHLHTFIEHLMAQFYSFGASEEVELFLDYRVDENLQLLLDKGKVEKIVQNFLSNALKFTPPNGKVQVFLEETEQAISISVMDTGKGIHHDDLPFIFDRFFQSRHDKGMVQGGTGIGLSLCRELAELMGGAVWAESELGMGSIFYFKFPKKPVDTSLLSEAEPVAPKKELVDHAEKTGLPKMEKAGAEKTVPLSSNVTNSKRASILLVEDNPDLRNFIEILLPDFHLMPADNGKVALDLLMAENVRSGEQQQVASLPAANGLLPDLIISDVMMPVMDGFEFLEKVKSDDRWRHIPVIMLTAKVNIKDKLKALRIGVDDYLTKPFEEEELRARVTTLLTNYRERMELFSHENKSDEGVAKEGPVIAQADAEWLQQVEAVFSKNLSDDRFKIDLAALHLNLSLRQFQRRIKKITGLAANQYLQEMRLQAAKEHLYLGKYLTVKEVGYAVGYRNTKYFSTLFQKRFGNSPSSFLR